jgi:hypothetical protein
MAAVADFDPAKGLAELVPPPTRAGPGDWGLGANVGDGLADHGRSIPTAGRGRKAKRPDRVR